MNENSDSLQEATLTPLPDSDSDGPHLNNDASNITETSSAELKINKTIATESSKDSMPVFDEFLNKIKNELDSADDISVISEVVEKIRQSKTVNGNQLETSSSNNSEIEGKRSDISETSESNCKKNSIEHLTGIENSKNLENNSNKKENEEIRNLDTQTNLQFPDKTKSKNETSMDIEYNKSENGSTIGKENSEIRNHEPSGAQTNSKSNSHHQIHKLPLSPLLLLSPENFLESQKPSTSGINRKQPRLLSPPEQFINGEKNTGAISKNKRKFNQRVNQPRWFCSLCDNPLHTNNIFLEHCKHGFCSQCLINYAKNLSTARYLPCPHIFRNGDHCKKFFLHREVDRAAVKPNTNNQIINNVIANNNCQMTKTNKSNENSETFTRKLLDALDVDLYPNPEAFKCLICFNEIKPLEGVRLHECLHDFCKTCLKDTIKHCENPSVRCPYNDTYQCESELQQREIKELLPTLDYYKYLDRTLSSAEKALTNSFHCKTPNCHNFWDLMLQVEDMEDPTITCEICEKDNCVQCQAIHSPFTCEQYKQSQVPVHEQKSLKRIGEMINEKEAMRCTKCRAVVSKDEGCDGITCVICKTDLCWATKGPRWGPNGKGDTSAGCRCDPKNRRMCVPNCTGCH